MVELYMYSTKFHVVLLPLQYTYILLVRGDHCLGDLYSKPCVKAFINLKG